MTQERKRGLSLVLAMLMLFVTFSGSLGTAAYAEEAKAEETPVVEEAAPAEEKAAEEPEAVVDVAVLGGDKAEEAGEETPAEEVKEEKKEETKPEAGKEKLTLAEHCHVDNDFGLFGSLLFRRGRFLGLGRFLNDR